MRLASYNVENLFDRARAMNLETWKEGKPILDRFAALNKLLGEVIYSPAAKIEMAKLMIELGLEKSDETRFVILRRNKGNLLKRPKTGGIVITANGRAEWAGSLELVEEPVDEHSMRNTARVMSDIQADILAVVEAESRPALLSFNDTVIPGIGGSPFEQIMLIDGNDDRGIDVGLMTRSGIAIGTLRSHVDDRGADGRRIFSRDCPEFTVHLPSGESLVILVNHFKSRGFGKKSDNDARRAAQSARVSEIYQRLREEGRERVAVVGDLNEVPASESLAPLFQNTDLQNAVKLGGFDNGGYVGTHGSSGKNDEIDYILLSPALAKLMKRGGIFRKGMWPGVKPPKWEVYPELTKEYEAASDHAAVWVDLNL